MFTQLWCSGSARRNNFQVEFHWGISASSVSTVLLRLSLANSLCCQPASTRPSSSLWGWEELRAAPCWPHPPTHDYHQQQHAWLLPPPADVQLCLGFQLGSLHAKVLHLLWGWRRHWSEGGGRSIPADCWGISAPCRFHLLPLCASKKEQRCSALCCVVLFRLVFPRIKCPSIG